MTIELRRLGFAHFAFYRAYLEGADTIDLNHLADHYLGIGRDPRLCRSTLVWLQDELTAVARRIGDREAVRLLRLPRRLGADTERAHDIPSLEEFREAVDVEGVFNETELLALYRQTYPAATRSRREMRSMRLHARRFEALRRIESVVAEPPASAHLAQGWLDPLVAARLRAVGIDTLGQLVDTINTSGYRWYSAVPRVGPQAAARIVRWLAANAAHLTWPLQAHVLAPIRQQPREMLLDVRVSLTDLAPIETLRLSPAMSGAEGRNRAPHVQSRTNAAHDIAAINAWLDGHDAGSHTWRSYRTQAERILLWSVFERGKPLSSLDRDDAVAYQHFLSDVPAHWLGRRATPRWSSNWRPFAGPLAPASRVTALNVVKSLFQWLVEKRYLQGNPWTGIKASVTERQSLGIKAHHALTRAHWNAVMDYAQICLRGAVRERACFILLLGNMTGLRLAEMASATVAALEARWIDHPPHTTWSITVRGRGGKTRSVPFPERLMTALRRYLVARGLPEDPLECAPGTPLIGRLSMSEGPVLGAPALAIAFKTLFTQAGRHLAAQDVAAARRLAMASAHWLRHTHGARAIEAGMPLDVVQKNLGHASPATTAIYATTPVQRVRKVET